jgi:dihydroorotase
MPPPLLLRRVGLIRRTDPAATRAAAEAAVTRADVLIEAGILRAIAPQGLAPGELPPGTGPVLEMNAEHLWLGPPLVDPHSVLEDPVLGRAETLDSLAAAAALGGYGTVALLPWAPSWRDRPERLELRWPEPLRLLLWGGFSIGGADQELAPHADQIEAGAIGLAAGEDLPPLDLLEKGLQLAEMADRPVLLAPRDASLARSGFVRERVEALRAGWPLDPVLSETLPLRILLALTGPRPELALRLMNLSSAEGVALLRQCRPRPPVSVAWWHLIADSGRLDPAAEGWRVVPSLGSPGDREALIDALADGVITAVAIHHQPLDAEERLLPLDQRRPGVAGHGLALSLLWQELVVARGWAPERLWQALSWGPSRFLGLPEEHLTPGTARWILFDPGHHWRWDGDSCPSLAANQPCWQEEIRGAVVASGLTAPSLWRVPEDPSTKMERSARTPGR